MSRSPLMTTLDTATTADGLLMVPAAGRGPWKALRDLHGAMADMRGRGLAPRLTFVHAFGSDGKLVRWRHPNVAAFVLGYRLGNPN